MKINILGTKYQFVESEYPEKFGADGVCDEYGKTIFVRPKYGMLDETSTDDERKRRHKEVVRHEIIHAFFAESGLEDYYQDEVLVAWMAKQLPKIVKVINRLESM